jgi:MipA family protein
LRARNDYALPKSGSYCVRRSVLILTLLWATPALAQDATPDPARDTITIGLGGAIAPRFEGSDDYRIIPGGAIRGKVSGVSFITAGTALFVDLVPSKNAKKRVFGPMAHLSLNRSSRKGLGDAQVRALGKIPIALEVGANAGVSRTGVITSDFDTLSFNVAVSHDVTGIHDSLIVTPSINYGTPLSRKVYVGVSASATHVGTGYAKTYFGVTPAQSIASGL